MRLFDPRTPREKGLPRPMAEGPDGKLLPVPYSQAVNWNSEISGYAPAWGVGDVDGPEAGCLLCGEPVETGKVFVSYEDAHGEPPTPVTAAHLGFSLSGVVDGGALHDRCAAITASHCPTLKQQIASNEVGIHDYQRNTGP